MRRARGRRRYTPDWPSFSPRRRRGSRVTLFLLGLLVLVLAGLEALAPDEEPASGGTAPVSMPPAPTTEAVASPPSSAGPALAGPLAIAPREGGWYVDGSLASRLDATRVAVERVVDGDTFDVRAAQTSLRVRLFGVDTPERGDRCFAEAAARTEALLGRETVLVPDVRLQDRFGRELRYAFTPDGRSIDATLIAEGLALAWREDGALRDALVALEEDARARGAGCLWSP